RPQELRASLPPLFGADDQVPPVARMPEIPGHETPSPPQPLGPGNTAAPENIHTAKTQPLIPLPETTSEGPHGVGASEPNPEPHVAVTPAATTRAGPSPEASHTVEVEAKLDDRIHAQAQAASTPMPGRLADPDQIKSTPATAAPQARTLEQVIGELLEPVIRQWLEANLPRLVEEVVRKEVARAIAVERPTSVV